MFYCTKLTTSLARMGLLLIAQFINALIYFLQANL